MFMVLEDCNQRKAQGGAVGASDHIVDGSCPFVHHSSRCESLFRYPMFSAALSLQEDSAACQSSSAVQLKGRSKDHPAKDLWNSLIFGPAFASPYLEPSRGSVDATSIRSVRI
jgi:hypothetical protein